MKQVSKLLLLILATFQSTAHAELVIDDFEVGFVDILRPIRQAEIQETDLDVSHVLSRNREVQVINRIGTTSASLSPDMPDSLPDDIIFRLEAESEGLAILTYDFQAVDFTHGETLDRFQFEFTDVPALSSAVLQLKVSTQRGSGFFAHPLSPGVLEIPFADMDTLGTPDFKAVNQLTFGLGFRRNSGTYSLASIKVVPEPSAAVCLLFCLPALAFVRLYTRHL